MSRLAAFLVLVAIAANPAAALAQSGEPTLVIEQVEATGHPEVSLTVTVPPELLGIDLTGSEFRIVEGGETRRATVERLPNDDLQVILALDTSGSMDGEALRAAQAAAIDFLGVMPSGVQVALVVFAAEATLASPFGTDIAAAAAEVDQLVSSGSTALYDAIVLASAEFEPSANVRRIIVLLSDGGDTASVATQADAASALRESEIILHVVELESGDNDPAALQALAAATQGSVVPASDPAALADVFATVAAELVNRYRLVYESRAHGETQVSVEVRGSGVVATGSDVATFPAAPPPPATTTSIPETVPPTAAPAPVEGTVVVVPWHHQRGALYIGGLAMFLALAGLALFTALGRRRKVRFAPERAAELGEPGGGTLTSLAGRATGLADRSLGGGERFAKLNRLLESAGLAFRPAEFAVLHGTITVTVGVLGAVVFTPRTGGVLGLLAMVAVVLWLRRRANKRCNRFALQLPDVLGLMSGGLRAGYGLMQALDAVAASSPAPAGYEFRRAKTEVQLGKDKDTALRDMATRVRSEDFRWVVDAIEIHAQVGGDLGEILDSVGDTIRDRARIKRRIKGLAAEGRISALILGALPFVVAGAITLINPGYFADLTGTGIGRILLAGSAVLMALGIAWMSRITALKY